MNSRALMIHVHCQDLIKKSHRLTCMTVGRAQIAKGHQVVAVDAIALIQIRIKNEHIGQRYGKIIELNGIVQVVFSVLNQFSEK